DRGIGHGDQWRPHRLGDTEVARTALGADPTLTRRRPRNARALWFDKAATEIGEPGLTPHELRHTAASLAVSAGANVKAVQRMLGHASAAMTLDRYADLFDDDLDDVADRLDRLRATACGPAADFLRTEQIEDAREKQLR